MEAFGFSHFVMMPVMARDVLEVGPTGLGYLSAASGVGSALSTIAIASLGDFRRKGILLTITALAAGISLILFALSPWFILSLFLVALAGGTLMAYDVTMATMLQLLSDDSMRGRVLGIYGLTFGFTPVGGLLAGSIAAISSLRRINLYGNRILDMDCHPFRARYPLLSSISDSFPYHFNPCYTHSLDIERRIPSNPSLDLDANVGGPNSGCSVSNNKAI